MDHRANENLTQSSPIVWLHYPYFCMLPRKQD